MDIGFATLFATFSSAGERKFNKSTASTIERAKSHSLWPSSNRLKIHQQNQGVNGAGEGNRTLDSAWKADALPLNYTRIFVGRGDDQYWWMGLGSNQRRRKPADLQGCYLTLSRSGTHPFSIVSAQGPFQFLGRLGRKRNCPADESRGKAAVLW